MDPYNQHNPNSSSNPFSTPGYTPSIDASWGSPPLPFTPYQQLTNAFNPQMQQMQMQSYTNPFNPQVPQMQMQQNQAVYNMAYQQRQVPMRINIPSQQPENVEDDVEEVVPETQPENTRKRKGKGKVVADGGKTQKKWSQIEEEALAKAWINSSKNPIVGNNQTGDNFYAEVVELFHIYMENGEYRNYESVSSKWRKMNASILRFSGIYNQTSSNKRSGWGDEDYFQEALRVYEDDTGKTFTHVRAWTVLKNSSKWAKVPNEVKTAKRAAKRSKTSDSGNHSFSTSTGHCQININDEPEFDEPIAEEERPMGRDKAKKLAAEKRKQAASGSGNEQIECIVSQLEKFNQTFSEIAVTQSEKVKLKQKQAEDRLRRDEERRRRDEERRRRDEERRRRDQEATQHEDWRVLTTNVMAYPEDQRPALLRLQEQIKKKYSS